MKEEIFTKNYCWLPFEVILILAACFISSPSTLFILLFRHSSRIMYKLLQEQKWRTNCIFIYISSYKSVTLSKFRLEKQCFQDSCYVLLVCWWRSLTIFVSNPPSLLKAVGFAIIFFLYIKPRPTYNTSFWGWRGRTSTFCWYARLLNFTNAGTSFLMSN